MEGESIAIIDIASSLKMEHTSTSRIGGASTGVISTGVTPIHHICVDYGDGVGSGNAEDSDNSIVSSSSSSYRGRTTKQMKEDIFQQCVVCAKNKRGPKGSRERNIHHSNTTKSLL